MTHEPTRLLHDPAVGAALRRDLGAVARVDVGYDVSAGLTRFEGNLANGAGVAKAAGGSGGAVAGALLLAGGLAAALVVFLPGTAPAPTTVAQSDAGLVAPVVEPAPVLAPQPAVADPVAPVGEPAVAGPVARESAVADVLAPEPAIAVRDVPKTGKRTVRASKPTADKAIAPASPPAARDPADALREARELQAARSQLGRDAARALALAEAGAAEFHDGTFAPEWEGVAILALFELGRDEARARGEAFLLRHPNGTYAPRIRQALEP